MTISKSWVLVRMYDIWKGNKLKLKLKRFVKHLLVNEMNCNILQQFIATEVY
jgi:hypothetical protein